MNLNAKLTFADFCSMPSNAAAYERCVEFDGEAADSGGMLILHGPTSVGKTHLLHAIGNRLRERNKSVRIKIETCEHWRQNLIEALRRNRLEAFTAEYQALNVLLMDDVDLGKGFTQTRESLWEIIYSILGKGGLVALAGLQPIQLTARSDGDETAPPVFVQLHRLNPEDLIAVVSRRNPRINRNADHDPVRAACRRAQGDVRRAEGLLNTMLFSRRVFQRGRPTQP